MDNSPVQEILPFLRLYLPFAFAIGSFFYFAPSWIGRHKRGFWRLFAFNFLLGWTVFCWLISLLWAVTPEQKIPFARKAVLIESPQEVFGPPSPPERIDWRTIAAGSLLSIAMVGILFAIMSRGEFPLSLTKAPQIATASPKPSPTVVKTRRPVEIQASN